MNAEATVIFAGGPPLDDLGAELAARTVHSIETAATSDEVSKRLATHPVIDCLVATQTQSAGTGLELLTRVREQHPDLPVILLAADGSEQLASEAFAANVDDYLPVDPDTPPVEAIASRIEDAVEDALVSTRNRQQYETIVETVPAGVFVFDEAARIVGGNETGAAMLDYDSAAEALGTRIPDLVEEGVFHVEVIEKYLGVLPDLLSTGSDTETATFEFRAFPGSDDERVFEVSIALRPYDEAYRGSIGIIRDVTARKRRTEELEQYETIINAIPDPVYATDERGQFNFVNDAMEELTGYEITEAAEEGVFMGMTEDDIETSRSLIRELLAADTPRDKGVFEMDLVTRDGRSIPVENHMGLLPYEDGFQGTAGVIRDISDERRRARRLDVLDTVLRHNLRNDLNVVIGYAEMLSDHLEDSDLHTAALSIKSTATDLIRIGDEIRTLQNAVERDQVDRGRSTIDVAPIVDSVVDQYRGYKPAATVRADCPDELHVTADSTLQRGLADLVENALEHADRPDPTVTVSVETDCDPPRSAASDDAVAAEWVAIRVADDGPGIPEYERELITGDEDITPLKHSNGLGLWIVTWITESFGGDVTIADNDPRGSVVTLRLRRCERRG